MNGTTTPSSTGAQPERVCAGTVRAGDVLLHQGYEIQVIAEPHAAVFIREGIRTQGVAIECSAPSPYPGGTALWILYRRGDETLHRVRTAARPPRTTSRLAHLF